MRRNSFTPQVDWRSPLNKGLVAWWPFHNQAGNVVEEVVHGWNADVQNDTVGGWHESTHPGGNACFKFDGTDDIIEVPANTKLDAAFADDFTIAFWVSYPGNVTSDMTLVSKLDVADTWFYIRLLKSGDVAQFGVDGGGSATITSGSSIISTTAGNPLWRHLVCRFTAGSEIRIFVDGKSDGSSATSWTSIEDTDQLRFGELVGSNNYDQSLADVRVYDRALSAVEIAKLNIASRQGYRRELVRRDRRGLATAAGPATSKPWFFENIVKGRKRRSA